MPLQSLAGPLGKKRAAHLLRRTCFGSTPAEIDTFAALTPQQAFDLLYQEDLPDPLPPIDPLTGREWVYSGTSDANSESFELSRYLNAWMVAQTLATEVDEPLKKAYSFRENIVFFFHTLFTTQQSLVNNSRAIYFQNALFRKYAFDRSDRTIPNIDPELPDDPVFVNLKELTKKICVDNAMLVFLDGRLNVKGSPNENFARELLELYTTGRGLEGHVPEAEFVGDYHYFTEQDVQEGAKALSGFNVDEDFLNIDRETDLPRGIIRGNTIAGSHDNSVKQLSARLGDAVITPNPELLMGGQPTEESCLDEISQLIDIIYNQTETHIHICRRIYRYFVYHEVSVALQNDIIRDMADIFVANDFKLAPVLEALFTSTHFYDGAAGYPDDNIGGLIKSPIDMIVGFHKNFNITPPAFSQLTEYYAYHVELLQEMAVQGMDYYEPFEVAGYSAYHQFPIYNRSWITTNYLTNRYNFIRRRLSNGQNMVMGQVNVLDFVQTHFTNGTARDARSLIVALAEYFLPMSENLSFDTPDSSELTLPRLNFFLNAFLYSPQIDMDPEASWTFRWDNQADMDTVAGQLVSLINAMLQTPEYQLM